MLNQPIESESSHTDEVRTKQEEFVSEMQHDANVDYALLEGSGVEAERILDTIKIARSGKYTLWAEPTDLPGVEKSSPYDMIYAGNKLEIAELAHKYSMYSLNLFVIGIGVIVPALVFLIHAVLSNLFVASCIFLAISGTTSFIIFCIQSTKAKSNGLFTKNLKKGICFVMLSSVFMFSYFQFMGYSTISEPQFNEDRYQIGFGLNEFSLTSLGQELRQKYPDKSAVELMLIIDGFNTDDATKTIWKNWTIISANISLNVLYLGLFLSWLIGLSFMILDKKRITADFNNMKLDLVR